MKGAQSGGMLAAFGLLALVVIAFYAMSRAPSTPGALVPQCGPGTVLSGGQCVATGDGGQRIASGTVLMSLTDAMTGAVPSGVNVIGYYSDDTPAIALAADIDVDPESVSTSAPPTFTGYYIAGNDNLLLPAPTTWADQGDEYYLRRISDSYSSVPHTISDPRYGGPVRFVQEGVPTLSVFDNNAVEDPPNITVGAGGTVITTKIQIRAAANTCFGNPDFDGDGPVAVTFNFTDPDVRTIWKEVRPSVAGYKIISAPSNATKESSVIGGVAYVLPTNAICDAKLSAGQYNSVDHANLYEFFIHMEAQAGVNPGTGDDGNVGQGFSFCLWDKTWYYNDAESKWKGGYERPEGKFAAFDIGSNSRAETTTGACDGIAVN